MNSDPMLLSTSVVLALILVPAGILLVVVLVVLAKHRRDSRAARDRQAELERAWAARTLHLEGAVAAAGSEIRRLRDLDRRDRLTGVANRATFLEAFHVEWRRNRREATPPGDDLLRGRRVHDVRPKPGLGCGRRLPSQRRRRPVDGPPPRGRHRRSLGSGAHRRRAAEHRRGGRDRRLAAEVESVSMPGATAGSVATVTLSAGLAATVPGKGDPEPLLAAAEAALAAALSRGRRQVVAAPEVRGPDPA